MMTPEGWPVFRVARDADGIPCPKCGGYADSVDVTPEELERYNCGRGYDCCARAFVCRLCGTRVGAKAEAPEMG